MGKLTMRGAAVTTLAILTGCSGSAVCSGAVGPETLTVDASGFQEQADVTDLEVCVVVHHGEAELEPHCSAPGSSTISYTSPDSDYPAVLDYYVTLRTGESSFVSPEDGRGSHHMQCTATTTNVVLPSG